MPSEAMQRVVARITELSQQRRSQPQPPLEERRRNLDASSPPAPDDVTLVEVSAGGVPAEWIRAPGSSAERRLLYLHGGGFNTGSRPSHRRLASDISRAGECSVLLLEYRLAPEHPYPAALEDTVAAWRWLLAHGPQGDSPPEAAFIAGDSAGGGLALSTIAALREAGVRLPDRAATMSPWTDLTLSADSLTRLREADYFLSPTTLPESVGFYVGGHDPRDPLISPLFANFEGFPPLLMQAGECEILLDDTTRVAERAREAGVEVTVDVEPGAFHVYQGCAALFPEAQSAVDRVGAFLREV